MDLFDGLLGSGDSRPPAPEMATPDDVEEYNLRFAKAHGLEADAGGGGPSDPDASYYAKAAAGENGLGDGVNSRAEFPWLFDPSRGVRWDFDPVRLRNLAQENTWVGMLVQTITKELAETSWTITEADGRAETRKRLNTHPEQRAPLAKADDGAPELPDETARRIHDLLAKPSPDTTWQDLVEMWMGDLLEVGSLTGVKAFDKRAYADEDLVADPSNIEPRAIQASAPEVWTKGYQGKTGILNSFWQFDRNKTPGGGETATTNVGSVGHTPTEFRPAEVVWSDMTPRSNRRYGMPPTLLVQDFLESLDLAITQEQQYLSRGSIPSGAWVFEQWDREEVKEWKTENEENVKGKPHKSLMFAGRGGDVRFEAMSMNFSELEFTERMKYYARVVASVFQVPTAVVGIEPERVNYNTFQGERENFEANTLGPYLQKLERIINQEVIQPHYGHGYRFEFLPGMSESTRKMISDRVRSEFSAGIRTRNETRRELGLSDVDEDLDGFQDEVVQQDTSPEDAEGGLGDLVATQRDSADATAKAAFEAGDAVTYRWQGERYHGRVGGPPQDSVQPPGMPSPVTGEDGEPVYPVHQWDADEDAYLAIEGEPNTAKPESALAPSTANLPPLADADVINVAQPQAQAQTAKAEYEVGDETLTIEPPEYMVEAAEAAADAGEQGLIPGDCGTGVGDDRRDQIRNGEVGPDVVDEMATYLTSHAEDVTAEGHPRGWTDEEWADGCGNAQYAKWGGVGDGRAMEWAQRNSDQVAEARGEEPTYKMVLKADGLRNTDDWHQFDVQPADVDRLTEHLAADVSALFEDVLADDELMDIIDSLSGSGSEMDKSVTELTRRLRELLTDNDVAARIREALSEQTADIAADTVQETLDEAADAPAETKVDIEAIREQLADRTVEFADSFADELAADIRETVGDGWAEGKGTREIASDIADQADINEGWTGAERIARQELHTATGQARTEVAGELNKIEVWATSGDDRVRDAHAAMDGTWKRPGEVWEVEYPDRGVQKEAVPGDSEPGIGCRCTTLLRDIETVDDTDHLGV